MKGPADTILFRPHYLGDLMTGVAKGWDIDKSVTCKRRLIKIVREIKANRHYTFDNKYTKKGNSEEEQAISLLSRVKRKVFTKNEERFTNKYLSGEPDIIEPAEIIDVKVSFTEDTFPHPLVDTVDADYLWQGHGYLALLPGREKHTVVHTLVNSSYEIVEAELKKESYKWQEMDTPAWVELEIITRHTFERTVFEDYVNRRGCYPNDENSHAMYNGFVEVDINRRVQEFVIERDPAAIDKLYKRLDECRAWMNKHWDQI